MADAAQAVGWPEPAELERSGERSQVDLAWPTDDPFDSGPQLMVETRTSF